MKFEHCLKFFIYCVRVSGPDESMLEDSDDSSSSDDDVDATKAVLKHHRHDIILKSTADNDTDVTKNIVKKGFFKSSRTK